MSAIKRGLSSRLLEVVLAAGSEPDHVSRFTRIALKLGHISFWLGFIIGATIVV